jgi:NAD(P)-dependent dehydrogenase (short-subunit alcohol dehydrogenase family)
VRVVITGASRGLGLELVRQHARRGDEVLATCRRPAEAAALAAIAAAHPGAVRLATLDVDDPESIAAAAAEAARWPGAVDLLWSNAGIYPGSPGTDVAEGLAGTLRARDGLAVLATNAVGAILVAQAFLPLLRRGTRPRLAAVSSGYGSVSENQGTPYWYGASKAALNMLHRSLAHDPAARGVTVVVLSPGWARTDMGGPGAPTPVEDAVAGMLRVMDGATDRENGQFLDWMGGVVPW